MFEDDESIDDFINELVELGMLIEHIDKITGEKKYEITEKSKEFAPFLWESHLDDVKKSLYRQWQYGMVDITFSEEGPSSDLITLTDLAFNAEEVAKLPEDDRNYLNYLIKVFQENYFN